MHGFQGHSTLVPSVEVHESAPLSQLNFSTRCLYAQSLTLVQGQSNLNPVMF